MAMAARSKTGQQAPSDKESEEGRDAATVKGSLETIIKTLLKKGKEKGVITYDEFNKVLPAQEFSSEQIEDAMTAMTEAGIQMAEGGDDGDDEEKEEKEEKEGSYESGGNIDSDDTGRTDDPVRMYL